MTMLKTLNIWACGAFCALFGFALFAQTIGTDTPGFELQADGDQFAEATKALNAATDKDTRRRAIDQVLVRAEELKSDPAPLVAVLKNRQPEALYSELLAYLKENEKTRHVAFLPALISAANDGGEKAAMPRAIVLGYNAETAIAAMQAMLKGEDTQAAIAAAAFAREKVGKIKGRARLAPPLIDALASSNSDLRATAGRALRDLTLLEFPDDAARWREWLGQKSEESLIEEIANRETEALRKSEAARKELEDKLVKVTLDQLEAQKENLGALVTYLRDSEFLRVRLDAVRLLTLLLPKLEDDAKAQPAIDAMGAILLDASREEKLRIDCARALALRPNLAFAFVDKALEQNGLSASLKLACVQALKDGRAAARLAALLAHEIDGMNGAGGALLPDLLAQAQSVFDPTTTPEARAEVLAQVKRLLRLVETRFGGELPIGERDRFASLAQQAAGALVGIARVRATDISDCVEPLFDVVTAMGARAPAAAASCLRAVREALGVQSGRVSLLERLQAEPLAGKVRGLYDRAVSDATSPSVLIAVLAIYSEMGVAPAEVVEAMLKELLANAEAAQDTLSTDSATTTRRGAIRRLLSRTTRGPEAHAALIKQLLDRPYGDNDVLDLLRNLPQPRSATVVMALQGHIEREPLRIGLLVSGFENELSAESRNAQEYKDFSSAVYNAVRAEFVRRIAAALTGPLDAASKESLTQFTQSRLWKQFLSAAYECLSANAAQTAERDVVVGMMMERLKALHPGRYNEVALTGAPEDFKKALGELKAKLAEDGYSAG
jgi:hypothetical protein